MILADRVSRLKPSPTLAIAARARELKEAGHDVISLSVGEPDWDTFDFVKAAGIEAIQKGDTKYAPANGILKLRTAIADKTSGQIGLEFNSQQVTVSTGAKFILFSAFQVLLDPGDEVLIPVPYWVSYPAMVELAGAKPVLVSSAKPNHFKPGSQDFAKHVNSRTKLLVLNSPSNPTGLLYSREELGDLAEFLRAHPQISVVCDDIYNELVFGEFSVAPHLLQMAPDLRDRVLVVNGASKTYSMTGWRLGWALGPQPVISAMSNYQSQSSSCASPFTQAAVITAIQHGTDMVRAKVEILKQRRDFFVYGLNAISGWHAEFPEGAFYVWADIRGLLGRRLGEVRLQNSQAVATQLLQEAKIAAVPGAESGVEGYLRLSFALHEDTLSEALQRIQAFTTELES